MNAIATLRALVKQIDPEQFTEEHFCSVDATLSKVISALERLANHVDDTDQRVFLGDSIADLRDARSWIVRGYSPDPGKRPNEHERRELASAHAAKTLTDLFL